MPISRRRDVYRYQAHALRHGAGLCAGGIPHPHDFAAESDTLLCPICQRWFEFEALDEDHAPQKGEQSSLGGDRVVVITCREDNTGAGGTYEAEAHRLRSALGAIEPEFCPVHEQTLVTESGLYVVTDGAAFKLTDVRAAFLLAFATLGYRWALSPRLDRIRNALRTGELSHIATDFQLICTHDTEILDPHQVYEILDPVPCVLVTGAVAGVILPCHRSPNDVTNTVVRDLTRRRTRAGIETRTSIRFIKGRSWPWPLQYVDPGGQVSKTWDAVENANFFHYDRCDQPSHHGSHALSRDEVAGFLSTDRQR